MAQEEPARKALLLTMIPGRGAAVPEIVLPEVFRELGPLPGVPEGHADAPNPLSGHRRPAGSWMVEHPRRPLPPIRDKAEGREAGKRLLSDVTFQPGSCT